MGVVLGRLVEGRADDLALDAAAHVRDFLGPLADECDHEQDLGVVGADPVGDLLEEHRLAGLGRADDEGALALAQRVDQVDQPLAQVLRVRFEIDQLVGMDRRQIGEDRAATGGVGVDPVDAVDPKHAPVLLGLARGAHGAGDAVTDAQTEAADLARADVDVLGAGQQAMSAHEPEAFVHDVEDATGVVVPGALGLALQDAIDELVLAVAGRGVELEIAADLAELGDAHIAQVADLEIVAFAGGLDLLLLLVLADGGAVGRLGATTRSTVAGALIALVGAGSGHLVGVTCR